MALILGNTDKYLEMLIRKGIERVHACPKCNGKIKLDGTSKSFGFRCTWKFCRARGSFLPSFLVGAKLSLEKRLAILELWSMGVNTYAISRLVLVSRKSIWFFFKKVSRVVVPKFYSTLRKLGRAGMIVEIDESKFGKRKYNRGHVVDGVWVLGMRERSRQKRTILVSVPDRKVGTLIPLLRKYIDQNSIIYSDCFKSYFTLSSYFNRHLTVNHSLGVVNLLNGVHTNTIEGTWSAVKAQTPIRKRTRDLVDLYLVRYMIRKENPDDPMEYLINVAYF